MARKRGMPGRSAPKFKKNRPRAFTPSLDVAQGEADQLTAKQHTPSLGPVPTSAIRSTPPLRARSGSATGLITDYSYVKSDLKRIAILALAIFAILIGLTFVIR